ncbi:MAG TPA: hypothetical protein VNZ52_09565 [Candidatus Thermoplasmatota archaeon]|nr:hypothetical protein [Candidatus Thermoplasmatota archaeon]
MLFLWNRQAMSREIPILDEEGLARLLQADRAVLILAKSTSASVDAYLEDLKENVFQSPRYADVAIGVVEMDGPLGDELKLTYRWANHLEFVPFTVLLARGEKIDGFGASVGKYLALRMEKRFFAPPKAAAPAKALA